MRKTSGSVKVETSTSPASVLLPLLFHRQRRARERPFQAHGPARGEGTLEVDGEAGPSSGRERQRHRADRSAGGGPDRALDEIAEDEGAAMDAGTPVLSGSGKGGNEQNGKKGEKSAHR